MGVTEAGLRDDFCPPMVSVIRKFFRPIHRNFQYSITGSSILDDLMNSKRKSTTNSHPLQQATETIGGVLCARVRELRRKKAWTLEEMSAACGVSRSMLSEIERGRANPTLVVAYRIALAFGMSLGDLVEIPSAVHRIDVIRADD